MKKAVRYLLMAAVMCTGLFCIHSEVSAKDADGNIVIVIDPGHGEQDPGSKAITGLYEKDANFAIATALKAELESYDGVKVYFTRSEDTWMTNTGRAMVASAMNADFLISVHNNIGNTTNSGALAYCSVNANYKDATTKMCTDILSNLEALGLKNNGVQTRTDETYTYEDYYTLMAEGVRAGIPSIIVEHCFLDNAKDAAFISNSDGTVNGDNAKAIGVADAKAIASYFELKKRTAEADSKNSLTLQKGYSVAVTVPGNTTENVSWYAIDKTIATVDEKGIATAVSPGTTNIVYKTDSGDTGYCTLTVEDSKALKLVGGLDPTFYYNATEMNAINVNKAFGFVIYSDGTAKKIALTSIGTPDLTKVGIQDIPIKYNDMEGNLRVVFSSSDYKPEVTLPAETEPATTTVAATTQSGSADTSMEQTKAASEKPTSTIMSVLKYLIVLVVVIIIGTVLFVYENSRNRRRRGRRRR